jgi:hypothetical protein
MRNLVLAGLIIAGVSLLWSLQFALRARGAWTGTGVALAAVLYGIVLWDMVKAKG